METCLKMAPRYIYSIRYTIHLQPEKRLSQVTSLPSYTFWTELKNNQLHSKTLVPYMIWPHGTFRPHFLPLSPTAYHPSINFPDHLILIKKQTNNKNMPFQGLHTSSSLCQNAAPDIFMHLDPSPHTYLKGYLP